MSGLEKILIVVTILLAIAVVGILMVPDASGQTGFQSLSPVIGKVNAYVGRTSAGFGHQLAAWMDSAQTWVRQAASPSNASQGNPIDSAVNPVGSYGQEQKDVFGKPLQRLQH